MAAAKPPFWAILQKRPDKEEAKPEERVTPISQLFAKNAPTTRPEEPVDSKPFSLLEWVNRMKEKTSPTPEPEPEGAQASASTIMPVSAGLAGGSGKTKRRNASAMYLTSPLGTVGNPRTYGGNLGGR